METPPNSVQLMFQTRYQCLASDEVPHSIDVVFFAWFKPIAIVENQFVVLRRDELGVDVRLALFMLRNELWKQCV
jgi:hypothetical protein